MTPRSRARRALSVCVAPIRNGVRQIRRLIARKTASQDVDLAIAAGERMIAARDRGVDIRKTVAPLIDLAPIDATGQRAPFWAEVIRRGRQATELRRRERRIATLWGVTPILATEINATADRMLGLKADSIVFTTYHTSERFSLNLSAIERETIGSSGHHSAFRRLVFAWALQNYDVFNFYNDCGILLPVGGYGSARFGINLDELEMLREAGKTVITYAYGADVRFRRATLAMGPLNLCMECPEPGRFCVCDDEGGKAMLLAISARVDRMLSTGLALRHMPMARHLNYHAVDIREFEAVPKPAPRVPGSPLIVGHFPNHGHFKGTRFLRTAIDTLRTEGLPIELYELSGMPRSEILAAMRRADVVVDQLITGAYGLTGVESMGLGIPTVAWLRDDILISGAKAPIIVADPTTIADKLRELVARRDALDEIRSQSADFVRKHHSLQALARQLASLYAELGIDVPCPPDPPDKLRPKV